jgi:hypothetical protein
MQTATIISNNNPEFGILISKLEAFQNEAIVKALENEREEIVVTLQGREVRFNVEILALTLAQDGFLNAQDFINELTDYDRQSFASVAELEKQNWEDALEQGVDCTLAEFSVWQAEHHPDFPIPFNFY